MNINIIDSTVLLIAGEDNNNIYSINTPEFNLISLKYDGNINCLNTIVVINNNFIAIGTDDKLIV